MGISLSPQNANLVPVSPWKRECVVAEIFLFRYSALSVIGRLVALSDV